MISTRDLSELPGVERLRALTQSLATLDAILAPVWGDRYYSFDAHWGAGRALAAMRDGSGDEWYALFTPAGAVVKGFAHEAPMSPYAPRPPAVWPGVLDELPSAFADARTDPALSPRDTTFCVWRTSRDRAWQRGDVHFPAGEDPDGSAGLLAMLGGDPRTYRAWAEGYYGRPVRLPAVVHVYEGRPLTEPLVAALNPDRSLAQLAEDLGRITYPAPALWSEGPLGGRYPNLLGVDE
jgi:hypothetical protein